MQYCYLNINFQEKILFIHTLLFLIQLTIYIAIKLHTCVFLYSYNAVL